MTDHTSDDFPERLRAAMAGQPLRGVHELAERSQIRARTIWRLLAGTSEPRTQTVRLLADALGVRRSWLAWAEGPMKVQDEGS